MDIYLLRRLFSFYFLLLMAAFVFLFEAFTFFELLDDIARHRIAFVLVINYFRFLPPYLLYNLAPLGALVAVLVTLGTMSKNNEIVAIKASGVSLYRLAVATTAGRRTACGRIDHPRRCVSSLRGSSGRTLCVNRIKGGRLHQTLSAAATAGFCAVFKDL